MRELPSAHFVKICGVTTSHDAKIIVAAGADAIGLILAPSTRRITNERAAELCASIGPAALRTLVFRDAPADEILAAVASIDADAVQIHGDLDAVLALELMDRVHVIKALSIESREYATFDESTVSAVLLDGPNPGSGQSHSWERLQGRSFVRPLIVAGGLAPSNVAATIVATGAWGVDCASGVEVSPGIKDPTLVSKFVEEAHRGFSS